jgi:hypothetical protein
MAADFAISIKNLTCKSKVVPVFHTRHTMKMYMGVEVYLLAIVNSALNGESGRLFPQERALCIYWIGEWIGAETTRTQVQ